MRKADIRSKWLRIYERYRESEQSCREFCAEVGVNFYTLKGWIKRFEKEGAGRFKEIALPAGVGSYMVVLRNGRKLELPEQFSLGRVRRLMELCESC